MLLCVTASHRTTDFALLDRVSRDASTTARDVIAADPAVRGAVVLATCNRFEAYLDVEDALAADPETMADLVFTALGRSVGEDADELRSSAEFLQGDEAVRHLFAVSSGLESVVVGEDEISGQVQRALATARAEHTSSSALERAFQRAARTSRDVRRATDLGAAGRSMVRLALDLAASRIANWSEVAVLVVGTGRYAATTIAALRARGARDIRVFSATGRADHFALRYGVVAEHDVRSAIAGAELVITCTARYTVTSADIPDAARRLIVDLGLPRNVEPSVGQLPGVELLDLELLALHAPLAERGEGAQRLVATAASEFGAEAQAAPGIVALRKHVMAALDDELARSRARGGDHRTEEALRHLAGVLVHTPSVRARRLAAEGRSGEFLAGLEALYGVRVEPGSAESNGAANGVEDATA
ncbi:MAG TPA: glutamyl-tRNA reductase [Pseudolysinimonas sp.]|nr:glutamyl-tRNA reductase [Pseudolysinimonas sp.]